MADRLDFERLRGFDFRLTDRQTDRRTDRQTFAIVESLSRLKTFEVKELQNPLFIPTIVNWRDMVTNLTIIGNGRL